MNNAVFSMDLKPFLPHGWDKEIRDISVLAGEVHHSGGGPGSLAAKNAGLDYRVLTRGALLKEAPWLALIHEVTLPALMALNVDKQLEAITEDHGLNLNVLSPSSSLDGLEWHLDGGDVERVVVLSPDTWTTEGRFMIHDGTRVQMYALAASQGLCVATGRIPHAVEVVEKERVTVMFAFRDPTAETRREEGQDRYLYGDES